MLAEKFITHDPDLKCCPECGRNLKNFYRELKKLETNPLAWAEKLLELTCPGCQSQFWPNVRQVTGHCETCAQPMSSHLRCRICGMLAGPGHECEELVDGRCRTCATGIVCGKEE